MALILGLGGFFHDFNAAVIDLQDEANVQVYVAEEERYSRKKHHPIMGAQESSIHCIEKCLRDAGKRAEEVTHLVFSDTEAHPLKAYLSQRFPRAEVHHVPHHLCHAAAAFFSSGLKNSAILCLDGFGDGKSGVLAHGLGNRVEPVEFLSLEDSIGLEYLRVTYQIGLGSFGAEGKTQGLAAYGEPRYFEDYMNEIELRQGGVFGLSPLLKNMAGYLEGEHYIETRSLFNDFILKHIRRRFKHEPIAQEHKDMAASVQQVLNHVALHSARALKEKTASPNLVVTGGVALNSTMNGVLMNSGLFENVYAHPSASDRGNALGAALYVLAHHFNVETPLTAPLVYGGQAFSAEEMEATLHQMGVSYRKTEAPSQEAAQLVAGNKIVGWFQGRSELGARALGNRSILAHPGYADNKDLLNEKVKHREYFRPFAPSVLSERAHEYFDTRQELPYMTMTVDVRKEKHQEIPAVTHQDGTARIQTVTRSQNPAYYALIEAFGKLTGTPVVVNTSFNDNEEPIVESPRDAIRCFQSTGMDALVMGNYVLSK